MSYLFYASAGVSEAPTAPGEEYAVRQWRPTWKEPIPPGCRGFAFWVWFAFHTLRLFGNRDYAVLLIFADETLVHRSCLFPPSYRFPFMQPDDLQIGDTWTHPDHRGRGLAAFALQCLAHNARKSGRTFWYVADAENTTSLRVVEKAGFRCAGQGVKRRRLGIGALGFYSIQSPVRDIEGSAANI